jgi:ribosomal protein S18 acetylase RimI-like enzyme
VSEIVPLEDAMVAAWPALEVERDEAWLLRASGGISRRSDSVHAPPGGTSPVAERIARAEAFYRARRLPPRFQLSPASEPGLDEELERRGYVRDAAHDTDVLVGPLTPLAAADATIELAPAPQPDWLALWDDAEGYGSRLASAQALLARVDRPAAYALARVDGIAAAQARAVADGEHVGLYAVATRPGYRRRGLARDCLAALAAWGQERGATYGYLLVERSNAPARELYARLGFESAFAYWYRTRH